VACDRASHIGTLARGLDEGPEARVDSRRHEAGLEGDLPVPETVTTDFHPEAGQNNTATSMIVVVLTVDHRVHRSRLFDSRARARQLAFGVPREGLELLLPAERQRAASSHFLLESRRRVACTEARSARESLSPRPFKRDVNGDAARASVSLVVVRRRVLVRFLFRLRSFAVLSGVDSDGAR
jgi:hypothetical protein